ncbi:MAG: ATP-binding protein [candidate division WOR-3 bacterium]
MSWPQKTCPALFRRCVERFRLLEDGESVVVGVSGGADSLCLLHLLHDHNRRGRRGWAIHPVHVDPGFAGWNSTRVERVCARIGLPCRVIRIDLPSRLIDDRRSTCHVCARERRKALFEVTTELGGRKLALAHNMDDVNETFLLNLLFASSAAAIVPRQEFFGGRLEIIRPLYYMGKPLIRRYLAAHGVRALRNPCPADRSSTRMQLRRILERLYRQHPRTRTNLFWGIHNLKPEYLPSGTIA